MHNVTRRSTELSETILFDHGGVRAGILRCGPAHREFADLGPTANYVLAFPTSPILLSQVNGIQLVAGPGTAVLMNRGERVLRAELAPTGDRCWWIGLDDAVAHDIAGAWPIARSHALFGVFGLDVSVSTYLAAARLVRRTRLRQATLSASAEAALDLVDQVIGQACSAPRRTEQSLRQRDRQRQLIAAVRADILRYPSVPVDVTELARRHGVTPYALARAFRGITGTTVTDFGRTARLLLSIEHLDHDTAHLGAVAAAFGFTSHSHYSMWFRRVIGMTPSEYRGRRRALRYANRGLARA